MTYAVRTDPLVLKDLNTPLPDQPEPDRPGQLPLLSTKGLLDPRNPMHSPKDPTRTDLFKAEFLRDPTLLRAKDREDIAKALNDSFGTPAEPKVAGDGVDDEALVALALTPKRLAAGSRLYRIHCLHCHGVTGDGRGPTAPWINPHPRDFRQGLFKFQSVNQLTGNKRPHRDDLRRTLEQGIENTGMPSFTLLSDRERDNLISYVIHLSIRGKVEFSVIKDGFRLDQNNQLVVDDKALEDANTQDLVGLVKAYVPDMVKEWADSQKAEDRISVPPYPYKEVNFDLLEKRDEQQKKNFEVLKESVKNGERIFREPTAAKCDTCHVDLGRRARFKYDDWGTLVKPTDLTRGVYRGGRRPIDLFYRLHSGINGSGMAQFGANFKGEELWDIVNFLQVLPYPAMRRTFGLEEIR